MNPEIEQKLRKIERYSNLLRALCWALFVPVIVLPLAATTSILAGWTAHIAYDGQTFVPSEMALSSRLLLAVVMMATGAVAIKGLSHLRRLLGNYSRREIFTSDSARQIRQFGITCVLWSFVKLAGALVPLAMVHGPHSVSFSGDTFFIGLVIIGLSWFAEMAAALREENDLTI